MTGWARLEDLVEKGSVSYGIVQPGREERQGIPILRVGDLDSGTLVGVRAGLRVSPEIEARFARTRLRGGEVVVSLVGTVGRAAVVPLEMSGWNVARAVAVLRPTEVEPEWLALALRTEDCQNQISAALNTTVQATLNLSDLRQLRIPVPGESERRAIAQVLGALDDKIAANHDTAAKSQHFRSALVESAGHQSATVYKLAELVAVLSRGRAPKYVEVDGMLVINQKCVRNGSVLLTQARLADRARAASALALQHGDCLVNSTGAGTLGRVGVWRHNVSATVDSHITVVRFDAALVDPWCASQALVDSESAVEALGEGSTGQTELSRNQLGSIELRLPVRSVQDGLSPVLMGLHDREQAAAIESERLATLRDTLLPHLMSGRLSVRQAESVVSEAL